MKQAIRISLIVMLFLLLILINANVYATSGTTINSNTRVRKEASTSADIVTVISQGEEVEIIAEDGDWYQISYSSYTGYIRKDLLNVTEATEEETTTNTVTEETSNNQTEESNSEKTTSIENEEQNETTENTVAETQTEIESEKNSEEIIAGYNGTTTTELDVRILPSANSTIISTLSENTEFTVVEIINKWCHIETEEISGWVFLSKIDLSTADKTEEVSETEDTTR